MSRRVLITGMSATGKSSVIETLRARGRRAVDLDTPWWSEYADIEGGRDWVWRQDRVAELLAEEHPGVLYVSGCAPNQGVFRAWFDHVVLLTASDELTVERLRTRTNNPYGKRPGEVDEVLANKRTVEPLLEGIADLTIDTTVPLDEVVGAILRHAVDSAEPDRRPNPS